MQMNMLFAAFVVLVGTTATGCAANTDTAEDTTTSDVTASEPTPIVQTSSCTTTPTGAFGLTRVEVADTRVTWHTNSPVPDSGVVAFTVRDGATMRGLKFLDGEVIANYTFDVASAQQQESSEAPTIIGTQYEVVITAGYTINDDWTADLEIDTPTGMESTGTCIPT